MSTGRVQDLRLARALLKRVSERCSDQSARSRRLGPVECQYFCLCVAHVKSSLYMVPTKRKSMRTANAASVEPAGREEMSRVERSKPSSARALLKRESERCSDRPEKVSGQPGLFCRTCLKAHRRQRNVYRHGAGALIS
jgi:hypothetical protein